MASSLDAHITPWGEVLPRPFMALCGGEKTPLALIGSIERFWVLAGLLALYLAKMPKIALKIQQVFYLGELKYFRSF